MSDTEPQQLLESVAQLQSGPNDTSSADATAGIPPTSTDNAVAGLTDPGATTPHVTLNEDESHQSNQQEQQNPPVSAVHIPQRGSTRIHVQTPTGAPRPRIQVNRSSGRVRVDMGSGNIVTLPMQRPETNGGTNTRGIRLEPLVPQAVEDSTGHTSEDESLVRFKCAICFEFMKDPVSCGSSTCSSRFCNGCLMRVAQGTAPNKPKCPTCRVEFSAIVRDDQLKHELFNGPSIQCRYEGCSETMRLAIVLDHERVCPHCPLRCRYAKYGCSWTGTRGQVAKHESTECHLARVSTLVDHLRSLEADHSARLEVVQQQATGSVRMLQVYRQNAQRDQHKSVHNLFNLLEYCHVLTCSTNHFFFAAKDGWQSMYRTSETRAAVFNSLALFPTFLVSSMIAWSGVNAMIMCFFPNPERDVTPNRPWELLLEDTLFGLCLGMLASILLVANLVDYKSSIRWRKFPLPGCGKPPVLGDVMAVSIFTIYLGVLEFHGAGAKSFLLWIVAALASTFFPAVVLTLSQAAARTSAPPTAETIVSLARSLGPLLFGLRYCVLACYFGMFPCLDAAILSVLLYEQMKEKYPMSVLKSSFMEGFSRHLILTYLGVKMAILSIQFNEPDGMGVPDSVWWIFDSVWASVTLVVLTLFLNHSLKLGVAVATKVITRVQVDVRPDRIPKDHNMVGLFSFGVWTSLILMLFQFQ